MDCCSVNRPDFTIWWETLVSFYTSLQVLVMIILRINMKSFIRISFLMALIAMSACQSVRLISDYDEYTDKAVSELQNNVEKHLTKMEKLAVGFDGNPVHPDCDYSKNQEFYVDSLASARTLKTRNEIRPKNDITVQQLERLLSNLNLLETLHQGSPGEGEHPNPDHCLSFANTTLSRASMDQMFSAILKLEDAKKRGETK